MFTRFVFRLIFSACLACVISGCNKRDLDGLGAVASDHAGRLERLKNILVEAGNQMKAIHKLLVEYDGRLMILSTEVQENGDCRVIFSDGDTIFINTAVTPQIGLSAQNTWIINGLDTGIKCSGEDHAGEVSAPEIRIQDGMWQISSDGGTTWENTGVKSEGKPGTSATYPGISVGENGNWYIDGGDTGWPLHGEDGAEVSAPEVSVGANGNWWIKNDNGEAEDTGVPAKGVDGEAGSDAVGAPYIKEVVTKGSEVSFIFSGNVPGTSPLTNVITVTRKVDFAYTILEDGKWVSLPRKPLPIPIGASRVISVKVQLPAGRTWSMRSIDMPDGFDFLSEETSGSSGLVTCRLQFKIESEVNEYRSGLVFYTIYDQKGDEYMTIIPVATQLYRIDAKNFDFTHSYVYRVVNDEGEQVAEICREYIRDGSAEGQQTTVIYPYDYKTQKYGEGYVTAIGGVMDHTTARYNISGDYPPGKYDIYFLSPGVFFLEAEDFMSVTQLGAKNISPDQVHDVRGNSYPVVKIGTQYWMGADLKSEFYANGDPITKLSASDDWKNTVNGGYCYYENSQNNGVLYNGYAISSGILAPSHWHIPDTEEWRMLEQYLGLSAVQADAIGWRGNKEGDRLKTKGRWIGDNGKFGTALFDALPIGARDIVGGFDGAARMCGWWGINKFDNGLWQWSVEAGKGGINRTASPSNKGVSVRCVRD